MIPFATPKEWNAWLAANPDAPEVWVLFHKKASGLASITWEQAVIEALAHGWIDGVKKSLNDTSYIQRFTPRRAGSAWSQKNIQHAENLIAAGRMTDAGLRQVLLAKENGRWDSAYSGRAEVPQDFLDALPPAAKAHYDTLNRQNRFAIYYRLTTAKRAETRAKRMATFIEKLSNGQDIL